MHLVAICKCVCIAIKRTAISNWHLESHINLHKWSLLSAPRCVDFICHFVCIPWEGCCIEPFLAKTRRIFIAPSLDILSCRPTGEQRSVGSLHHLYFLWTEMKILRAVKVTVTTDLTIGKISKILVLNERWILGWSWFWWPCHKVEQFRKIKSTKKCTLFTWAKTCFWSTFFQNAVIQRHRQYFHEIYSKLATKILNFQWLQAEPKISQSISEPFYLIQWP